MPARWPSCCALVDRCALASDLVSLHHTLTTCFYVRCRSSRAVIGS